MKRTILERIEILESLSNAKKLYSSKIRDGIFQELVSLDPSKTFKYIEKICKFYLEPGTRINDLGSSINLFDTLAKKNLIKIKDINSFKNYYDFEKYVSQHENTMSKSEERALIKNAGSKVILNTPELLVLLIENEEASIMYGAGTKWCIAAKDDNYFKSYRRERVTFYFIFQKNLPSSDPLYKIAVAVYPDGDLHQYFDAEDNKVPFNKILSLVPNIDLFQPTKLSNEEILSVCIKGTYTINSKGEIDVDGHVKLSNQNLGSILEIAKFGVVTGNFDCSLNNLTNLFGSPRDVGGSFIASNNRLDTLKGAPKIVGSNFEVVGNKLPSLKYCPEHLGNNLNVKRNKLISCEGSPEIIYGNLYLIVNNINNLKGFPKVIQGNIYADNDFENKFPEEDVRFVCKFNKIFIE